MLQLINLPDIVLETILSNLTYDEISRYRIVRLFFFLCVLINCLKSYTLTYGKKWYFNRFVNNLIEYVKSY